MCNCSESENITFFSDLTIVKNCYQLSDVEIKVYSSFIVEHREELECIRTRSKESYFNEIRAHKRLYKLGLFRKHTKDCDLEEPTTRIKEFFYKIIGGIK